ncbi:MAG TPA: FAD-dependent oxidoreductase [Azospirillaceae bacterium]|nr:FAD-dependent oxidoreductase [Azospirillaceae bacterium]
MTQTGSRMAGPAGGRLHVVGAGVAGLAAALSAASRGWPTTLYEAAPQAGGRCRAVDAPEGDRHDNGTHVLMRANRHALALLEMVGARGGWVEPEPDGLPVVDVRTGAFARVAPSPMAWLDPRRRPPGIGLRDFARLVHLTLPGRDRPVADLVGTGALRDLVVEPLAVAVLNTPVEVASSRLLGTVLRRMMAPGGANVLVARHGLGPDLVDPALRRLEALGAEICLRTRLRAVEQDGTRARALDFGHRAVLLGPDDRVVLALPPWAVARLLPRLDVPDAHEPIVNLHYPLDTRGPVRFVGMVGGIVQWALFRPGRVGVTISAARFAESRDADTLAAEAWADVRAAARAVGVGRDGSDLPAAPPPARIVREKRATIRQAAGPIPRPPPQPLSNLALAGDWLAPDLPATIEAAAATGFAAAGRMLAPGRTGGRAMGLPVPGGGHRPVDARRRPGNPFADDPDRDAG